MIFRASITFIGYVCTLDILYTLLSFSDYQLPGITRLCTEAGQTILIEDEHQELEVVVTVPENEADLDLNLTLTPLMLKVTRRNINETFPIKVSATDNHGNTAECYFHYTVRGRYKINWPYFTKAECIGFVSISVF